MDLIYSLPNWLRWLLVLPSSICGWILAALFLGAAANPDSEGFSILAYFFLRTIGYCLGPFIFVLFGSRMAPKYNRNVAIILAIMYMFTLSYFVYFSAKQIDILYIITTILCYVLGIGALFYACIDASNFDMKQQSCPEYFELSNEDKKNNIAMMVRYTLVIASYFLLFNLFLSISKYLGVPLYRRSFDDNGEIINPPLYAAYYSFIIPLFLLYWPFRWAKTGKIEKYMGNDTLKNIIVWVGCLTFGLIINTFIHKLLSLSHFSLANSLEDWSVIISIIISYIFFKTYIKLT